MYVCMQIRQAGCVREMREGEIWKEKQEMKREKSRRNEEYNTLLDAFSPESVAGRLKSLRSIEVEVV